MFENTFQTMSAGDKQSFIIVPELRSQIRRVMGASFPLQTKIIC